MRSFDRYDTNGVYELELTNGKSQSLVVTKTYGDHLKGYPASTRSGTVKEGVPEALRVGGDPIKIRHCSVIDRRFIDAFKSFGAYDFPDDGPTSLLAEVPEDSRDTVDYEFAPVVCSECLWKGLTIERVAGVCPECGEHTNPLDGS